MALSTLLENLEAYIPGKEVCLACIGWRFKDISKIIFKSFFCKDMKNTSTGKGKPSGNF